MNTGDSERLLSYILFVDDRTAENTGFRGQNRSLEIMQTLMPGSIILTQLPALTRNKHYHWASMRKKLRTA